MENKEVDNKELDIILNLHKALDAKFAGDMVVLDLRGVSPIADFFLLATAGSAPQMQAIAEVAEETLMKEGLKLGHREGVQTAKWVLLDFGSIVIHLFDKESREYYNLERTWGDAKVVEINQ